jgi:hypothetical protein
MPHYRVRRQLLSMRENTDAGRRFVPDDTRRERVVVCTCSPMLNAGFCNFDGKLTLTLQGVRGYSR